MLFFEGKYIQILSFQFLKCVYFLVTLPPTDSKQVVNKTRHLRDLGNTFF